MDAHARARAHTHTHTHTHSYSYVCKYLYLQVRILRLFRIVRIFRIFKSFEGLKNIVSTLVHAVPAIRDLAVMLAVVFYIFAVISVNVFGGMCVEGDEAAPGLQGVICLSTDPAAFLGRHAHFQGVGMALMTLFRISTGDAWGELMEAGALTAGARKPVSPDAWAVFQDLAHSAPLLHHESNATLSRTDDGAALSVAMLALRRWREQVQGRDGEEGWPFPGGAGEAWVQLVRLVLPACITDAEALALQRAGLADCDIPGDFHSSGPRHCAGSCGASYPVAWLFFTGFFVASAFIILQLVSPLLVCRMWRVCVCGCEHMCLCVCVHTNTFACNTHTLSHR